MDYYLVDFDVSSFEFNGWETEIVEFLFDRQPYVIYDLWRFEELLL